MNWLGNLSGERGSAANEPGGEPPPGANSGRAESFFAELDAMPKDEVDLVDIRNSDEIREANLMSGGQEQVDRFSELHARYPDSGNVCSLYASALEQAGRKDEAIAVLKRGITIAKCKSIVAESLGRTYVEDANFGECVRWYIRAVELACGDEGKMRFPFAYLACLYSAVAYVTRRPQFEFIARRLSSATDVVASNDLKQRILEMTYAGCDATAVAILEQAAQRYGW